MDRFNLLLGMTACSFGLACGAPTQEPRVPSSGTPVTLTAMPVEPRVPANHDAAGASLISAEREVWSLEGLLVAEAESTLRSPKAKQALGEPSTLRFSDSAENRVRSYLRANRSPELRARAKALIATTNTPTRTLLAHVAEQTSLTPEDVFMDYLTYDGLFDLAIMRYGHKRWKAGAYTGADKALADSFFSVMPAAPSAELGIKVVASDVRSIEINVFGGHVIARVDNVEVKDGGAIGRVGVVQWTSNYEQLRASIRTGATSQPKQIEELEFDHGGFRVNYAIELDEYMTWNATNPWAAVLYMTSANEVADMYAGAAAAGGFQSRSATVADPQSLPASGVLGAPDRGLAIKVTGARRASRLAATTPRRGQFLVVTIDVTSTLKEELRAPAEWFKLTAGRAEYPELGIARPGLAAAILPAAPVGARMLALPYTPIAVGKKATLVLIYDVPADLNHAALVLGADELSLAVVPK